MKKIELKSRKILRKIFGCISLTAVAFIFQACGPFDQDLRFTGTVKSKSTNEPIAGIKVVITPDYYGITDRKGKFDFYAMVPNYYYYGSDMSHSSDGIRVHFLDVDGDKNGHFTDKIMIVEPADKDEIRINAKLERKE